MNDAAVVVLNEARERDLKKSTYIHRASDDDDFLRPELAGFV